MTPGAHRGRLLAREIALLDIERDRIATRLEEMAAAWRAGAERNDGQTFMGGFEALSAGAEMVRRRRGSEVGV